jgi:hypothetical protein
MNEQMPQTPPLPLKPEEECQWAIFAGVDLPVHLVGRRRDSCRGRVGNFRYSYHGVYWTTVHALRLYSERHTFSGFGLGIYGGIQTSQEQDSKYWLVGDWTRSTLTG